MATTKGNTAAKVRVTTITGTGIAASVLHIRTSAATIRQEKVREISMTAVIRASTGEIMKTAKTAWVAQTMILMAIAEDMKTAVKAISPTVAITGGLNAMNVITDGVIIAAGITEEVTAKNVHGGTAPQMKCLPGLETRKQKKEGRETNIFRVNIAVRARAITH